MGASGVYEVGYDVQTKGAHTVHIELYGEPITHSPFRFTVLPGPTIGNKSRLTCETNPAIINLPCQLLLEAIDRYGNRVDEGGSSINARALGTGVGGCTVDDQEDGSYYITFTSSVVGEARVIIRLDNMEMAPLTVHFQEAGAEADEEAPGAAEEGEREGTPSERRAGVA